MAKLDENACDCFFILLHDLYHEIACQEQITRILYAISAVVLHPLFVSHMHDMPIGNKTLRV